MARLEKYILPTLALAYFFYCCLRAWHLPITPDEGATWYNFVPRPVGDLFAFTDPTPNNHLLNTLGIKFMTAFLPTHQFTVRIPALVGAAAFLVATVGFARWMSKAFGLQFLVFGSLLGNHFVCEFFSLARGYGMSAGYVLAAIWMAVRFFESEKIGPFRWAIFWAAVSVFASFTAVNFFLPFVFCLAIVLFQKKLGRPFWAALVFGTAALAAVCFLPFKRMAETDQFHFWSIAGFYRDTLLPMARGFRCGKEIFGHDTPEILANAFVAVWFLWGIGAILRWKKARFSFSEPTFFVWSMLTGTALVTVLQAVLIQTPYLSGRTALVFWPLFGLGLPFLAKWAAEKLPRIGRAVGFSMAMVLAVHFWNCTQLKSCQEWWFDAATFEVLDFLKAEKAKRGDGQKIRIASFWLTHNSLSFAVDHQYADDFEKMKWQDKSDPDDPAEFVYTQRDQLPVFEKNFDVVWEVRRGESFLLKRKP